MCDPVTAIAVATATTAAAGSAMSFMSQQQAAKSNKTAANLAYGQQMFEIRQRNVQIDQQQSENHVDAIIGAAKSAGAISASASDMGVDASTTASLLNASAFDAGRGVALSDLNSQDQRLQSANMGTEADFARRSQIGRVRQPSPLELGVNLAGDALKGFSTYASMGGSF